MKIINLFGGPGTGKSTTAAHLFALMKWENMKVELVNEYAKELTWDGRDNVLRDQLYILAKQNRKLERLKDHPLDFVITDSPILLGSVYTNPLYYQHFSILLTDVWESYDNINFMLTREKPYSTIGRNQSEEQARLLDDKIRRTLTERWNPYNYTEIPANSKAAGKILEIIKENYVGT